jgi:hypothetical protein
MDRVLTNLTVRQIVILLENISYISFNKTTQIEFETVATPILCEVMDMETKYDEGLYVSMLNTL